MKNRVIALLSLFVMGLIPIMAQTDDDAKYAVDLLKKGTAAPDFKMQTMNGEAFQFKTLKGKYVVLDFWASWCPDCRKDAPNIVKLYNDFHNLGVEFVGISMDTDADAWKTAVEKYGISYTQVSELKKFHDTDIAKKYGVKWIPSMYLIGKDGNVILGTVLSDKLEKTLTELFKDVKTVCPETTEPATAEP